MALTINTNIKNDADGYLIDAKNVKGGFIVVEDFDALATIPSACKVEGTLAYIQDISGGDIGDTHYWKYTGNGARDGFESVLIETETVEINIGNSFDITQTYTFTIDVESFSEIFAGNRLVLTINNQPLAMFYPDIFATSNNSAQANSILFYDNKQYLANLTITSSSWANNATLSFQELQAGSGGGGTGTGSGDGLMGYQFSFSFDTGDLDLGTAKVDVYATNDAFDKISERVNANITFADVQAICDKFNNDYTSLTQQENAVLVAILFFLPFVSRTLTHEFGSEPVTAVDVNSSTGAITVNSFSSNGNTRTLTTNLSAITLGIKELKTIGGGGSSESTTRTLYHIEVADSSNHKAIIPIYKEAFDKYLVEMNQVGQTMATAMSITWTTLNTIDDVKNLFDTQKSTQLSYGCDLAMNLLVKYAYESGENPALSGSLGNINLYYTINRIANYNLTNNFLGGIVSLDYDSDSTSETVQVDYSNGSPVNSNGEETDGSVAIDRQMGAIAELWFKSTPSGASLVTIDSNATFTYTEEQISGGGSSGEGGSVELKSNVYTLKFSSNNTYEYTDSNEETQTTELPMIWGITFEAKDIVNRFNAIIDEFNSTSGTSIAHITNENEIATTIKQIITMMIAGNMNNIRFYSLFSNMLVYLANGEEQTSDEIYANSLNKLYRMFGTTCGFRDSLDSPLESNFLANVPIIIMYGMLGGLIDYDNTPRELVPLDIENTGDYTKFCLKDTYELELINETPFEATGSGSGSGEPVSGGSGKLYEIKFAYYFVDDEDNKVAWTRGSETPTEMSVSVMLRYTEVDFALFCDKYNNITMPDDTVVSFPETMNDFITFLNNYINDSQIELQNKDELLTDFINEATIIYKKIDVFDGFDNLNRDLRMIRTTLNSLTLYKIGDVGSGGRGNLIYENWNTNVPPENIFFSTSATLTEYGTSGSGSGGSSTPSEPALPERFSIAQNLVVNMNGQQYKPNQANWSGSNSDNIRQFKVGSSVAGLTDIQALLSHLTGNPTYDVYNATKPTPCFVFCTESNICWKLQYDGETNGLRAYKVVNLPFAIKPNNETFTITSNDWVSDGNIAPFDYKTTVTITTTISANTIVELVNNNAVAFATYGFSIGDVTGQVVTIYSIGQPSANIDFLIKVGE